MFKRVPAFICGWFCSLSKTYFMPSLFLKTNSSPSLSAKNLASVKRNKPAVKTCFPTTKCLNLLYLFLSSPASRWVELGGIPSGVSWLLFPSGRSHQLLHQFSPLLFLQPPPSDGTFLSMPFRCSVFISYKA